jgi:hypothetical protein
MVCVETWFLGTHTMSIRFGLKTGCDNHRRPSPFEGFGAAVGADRPTLWGPSSDRLSSSWTPTSHSLSVHNAAGSSLAALHRSFPDDRRHHHATPSSPHHRPVPLVSPRLPPLAWRVALTSPVLLPPPSPHLVLGSAAGHRATMGTPGTVTMPGCVPVPRRVAGPTMSPWHRPGLARPRPIQPCWLPRGPSHRTPWAATSTSIGPWTVPYFPFCFPY